MGKPKPEEHSDPTLDENGEPFEHSTFPPDKPEGEPE